MSWLVEAKTIVFYHSDQILFRYWWPVFPNNDVTYCSILGLWVVNKTGILYSQETHVTFWCPMRFERYPLDYQVCKFKIGSYAYDENKMKFKTNLLQYNNKLRNTILDYNVQILPLQEEDSLFIWQNIGNYSLTGFEMRLRRNSLKYLVNYYLPSGLFVIVSWVTISQSKSHFFILGEF